MQTKDHRHSSAARGAERLVESFRPRPVPELLEHEMEDDLVLYDPRKDTAHILNSTAAVVWWLCDGQRTLEDISLRTAILYGKEPAAVGADIEEILSRFLEAGLVVRP